MCEVIGRKGERPGEPGAGRRGREGVVPGQKMTSSLVMISCVKTWLRSMGGEGLLVLEGRAGVEALETGNRVRSTLLLALPQRL